MAKAEREGMHTKMYNRIVFFFTLCSSGQRNESTEKPNNEICAVLLCDESRPFLLFLSLFKRRIWIYWTLRNIVCVFCCFLLHIYKIINFLFAASPRSLKKRKRNGRVFDNHYERYAQSLYNGWFAWVGFRESAKNNGEDSILFHRYSFVGFYVEICGCVGVVKFFASLSEWIQKYDLFRWMLCFYFICSIFCNLLNTMGMRMKRT